jgi:hypothetical protein
MMDEVNRAPVICDCAEVSPTMPTCRDRHLWDCPVAFRLRYEAMLAAGTDPEKMEQIAGPWLGQAESAALRTRSLARLGEKP